MRYLTRLRSLPLVHSPDSSLCFHKFTKLSSRKRLIFTSIQNTSGYHPATSFSKTLPARSQKVQVPCFDTIANSLSSRKNSSPLHSSKSTLFAQNNPGGGTPTPIDRHGQRLFIGGCWHRLPPIWRRRQCRHVGNFWSPWGRRHGVWLVAR